MPLTGYMKTGDPGRISSITTLNGDKKRRKKIELNERGGDSVYVNIYVRDCSTHKPRGAVVPVILMQFQGQDGWVELGKALCCPLCWKVLVKPEDVDLPNPKRQPEPKPISEKQRKALGKARRVKKDMKTSARSPLWDTLQNYIDIFEPFTVQDIMEKSGKSRTAIRTILKKLISQGKLEIDEAGGGGIGNRTKYRSP